MNTLYSDTVSVKSSLKISACRLNNNNVSEDSRPPVVVISDSESEEDVCTTVMKFTRSNKGTIKTKHKRRDGRKGQLVDSFRDSDNESSLSVQHVTKKTQEPFLQVEMRRKKHVRSDKRNLGDTLEANKLDSSGHQVSSAINSSALDSSKISKRRSREIFGEQKDPGKPTEGSTSNNYETYDSFDESAGEEAELVKSGIKQYSFFSSNDCCILEQMVDDQVVDKIDTFKPCTVDRAPLRNKYFFGEGYTYGNQMKRKGPGMEELYPKGFVDDIPEWIKKFVIQPLEKVDIIPKDWVNSCVINDYLSGGCIISHIDPKQLFDRPIFTISLMSDAALSFGVKFSFKPIRCSEPIYRVPLKRGCITSIRGYAADNITHCIRPQDTKHRRVVIILRRVFDDAPRLPPHHQLPWKEDPERYRHRHNSPSRSRHQYSRKHKNQDGDNIDMDPHLRKRSRRSAPVERVHQKFSHGHSDAKATPRDASKKHHRRSLHY